MKTESSVGGRTDGVFLDTADTSTGFDSDLDVTTLSPAGTPRVLNKVVFNSAFSSISDGEDTVVKVGSTGRAGKDTGSVHLEGSLVSFDSDGSGSLGDGGLEGGGVVSRDTRVGSGVNGGLGLGGLFASSVFSGVRVDRLELDLVRFEELEGEGH